MGRKAEEALDLANVDDLIAYLREAHSAYMQKMCIRDRQGAVKVVQAGAPPVKDGRLIFGLGELVVEMCIRDRCNTDAGKVLGFLYLKTEGVDENYSDIVPPFKPMRRLKVGTFKVESTGFRLGERFVKIIFDNALQRNVDEIYVTPVSYTHLVLCAE